MFIILFSLFAGFAAGSLRCAESERRIWRNSQSFAHSYCRCSVQTFGNRAGTILCLQNLNLGISTQCLTCFGEHAECSITHCAMQCMANSADPDCVQCMEDNCAPELMNCVGGSWVADLPWPAPRRDPARDTFSLTEGLRNLDIPDEELFFAEKESAENQPLEAGEGEGEDKDRCYMQYLLGRSRGW
jgi:hypothetical protein